MTDPSAQTITPRPQNHLHATRPNLRKILENTTLALYFLIIRGYFVYVLSRNNFPTFRVVSMVLATSAFLIPTRKNFDAPPVCVVRSGSIWRCKCPEGTLWEWLIG